MTETMRVGAMTAWLVASSLAAIPIAAADVVTPRQRPDGATPESDAAQSVDAAVGAANRAILSKLIPSQKAAIDKDWAPWPRTGATRSINTLEKVWLESGDPT